MALVSLVCPNCGAKLEFEDDDHEYGFCSHCGAKVQLHEIISVKHSGQVKLDNSSQAINRITLAKRAFQARNFSEAYEYYTRALEDLPNDFPSLYRKGICAIYLSAPDQLRTTEFDNGMQFANSALSAYCSDTGKSPVDVLFERDQDILTLLMTLFSSISGSFPEMSHMDSARLLFDGWVSTAVFCPGAIRYISTENVKEQALTEAINYCIHLQAQSIRYFSGTRTDKKGRTVDTYGTYKLSGADKDTVTAIRKDLGEQYNNLPSRLERARVLNSSIDGLNGEIEELKGQIRDKSNGLKTAKTAFWAEHPDLKKGRFGAMLPGLIILAVLVIGGLVLLSDQNSVVGLLISAAGILLGRKLIMSGLDSYENKVLSGELKAMKQDLADTQRQLKDKTAALAGEKKNLKDFTSTNK